MADHAWQALEELNQRLTEFTPYKLGVADPNDLKLLEKNARFMSPKTFQQLVENVAKDRNLSSLPFCWYDGKHYHVLSGNHRVKAARAAGLKAVLFLYTDKEMTQAERIAVQLSHNAITGEDNLQILKELWDAIGELDLKQYSGLETTDFEKLPTISLDSIKEEPLEFENVALIFTKQDRETLEQALDRAGKVDAAYVADRRDFDNWLAGLLDTKAQMGIKNSAAALMVMVEVFNEHISDLAYAEKYRERVPERDESWVPLRAIFGTDRIPRPVAEVLVQVVKQLEKAGDLTEKNRWQVLEYLAADYLGGD